MISRREKLTPIQRKRTQRLRLDDRCESLKTFSTVCDGSKLYSLIIDGVSALPEGESYPLEKQSDIHLPGDWHWGPCDMFGNATEKSVDGWRQILHKDGTATTRLAWRDVKPPKWFDEGPAMYIYRCCKRI